jgi:hypothetical protein
MRAMDPEFVAHFQRLNGFCEQTRLQHPDLKFSQFVQILLDLAIEKLLTEPHWEKSFHAMLEMRKQKAMQ